MKRAKRRGVAPNAAVVLGNVGTRDDVPLLVAWRATRTDHAEPKALMSASAAMR